MDVNRNKNRAADAVSGASPEDWAKRLRRGDAEAVLFVRERVERILAFKGLKIPKQDRDDLAQEILTGIWQAVIRPEFDLTAGFWGFVEVVTSRRCIDWLRRRKDQSPLTEDIRDGAKNQLETTLDQERVQQASEILAALDPECRKLIVFRLIEDRSYSDISELLGKTEGALRVQMYRCIRSAKQILSKKEPGLQSAIGDGKFDRSL
jgi:RNA polymerase sigma-70 factor (ECF subfamily)